VRHVDGARRIRGVGKARSPPLPTARIGASGEDFFPAVHAKRGRSARLVDYRSFDCVP